MATDPLARVRKQRALGDNAYDVAWATAALLALDRLPDRRSRDE
jgi:hypothetical protein